MRIEEAAARAQARIDSGAQVIVGTNKYRLEEEDPLETLEVDNSAVRDSQIIRLAKLRAERNEQSVRDHLTQLQNVSRQEKATFLNWLLMQLPNAPVLAR